MNNRPYIHNAKYYETDQMAIVHHSNYIRWFEEARMHWMDQIGVDFRDVEAMGITVPAVSVSCQYKHVTRFGDDVAITVTLKKYNGVRAVFAYEVRNEKTGVLHAAGETQHCFLKGEQVVNLKRSAEGLHRRFAAAAE